jgi:signal transduction histidine kinase/CHASE1-domain containing sensor protein
MPIHTHIIKLTVLTALFYLLLGGLGITLAIAPGYASPVFPAAGFAAAIMLTSGYRALIGVALGSWLLNLAISYQSGDSMPFAALPAAAIACGSALQALIAARLVKKWLGSSWLTMESLRAILLTLLLAGPVASLISASNGTAMLYLFGTLSPDEVGFTWWNWWIGDTLGVMAIMPLSIAILHRKHSPWRENLTILVLPVLSLIVLVAVAFFATSRIEAENQNKRIQDQAETFTNLLLQRFIAHQEALSALRRLIEVTPEMTYSQFQHFTQITLQENPDISALSLNAYVRAEDRITFEQRVATTQSVDNYAIRERDRHGKLVRARERPYYVAVQYITPAAENTGALGYDINSEPVRSSAISKAIASGQPAVTAPIQLVQEASSNVGLLLMHPAFLRSNYTPSESVEDKLIGFSVAVLKVSQMVEIATRSARNPDLVYHIYDQYSGTPNLYQSSSHIESSTSFRWRQDLQMADRRWHIEVFPTQAFIKDNRPWTAWAVGVGGLLLVCLLQMMLLIITGRTRTIKRKVNEQTFELKMKSDAISDRNAQLDAIFTFSPDGFVAFAEDGSIKYANPAFLRMTGTPEIRGKQVPFLDQHLKLGMNENKAFHSVAEFFGQADQPASIHMLQLNKPKKSVLQLTGIHTHSPTVPRILYVRDITHESEVQQMKSDFLSHAAHELRTPMTTILGYTELLIARDYEKPLQQEMLAAMQRQIHLIVNMINDLLDLARIEARRETEFTLERIDLNALLKALVNELPFDQERWPVKLTLPGKCLSIEGDMVKIRQALMNLITNAQKYSPDGGDILMTLDHNNTHILITIQDHGIGMTEHELERIGERFWRASDSGNTPGTGLGVAIVREILRIHRAELIFSSRYQQGTTATIAFPATFIA